jgi:hypothetical protein
MVVTPVRGWRGRGVCDLDYPENVVISQPTSLVIDQRNRILVRTRTPQDTAACHGCEVPSARMHGCRRRTGGAFDVPDQYVLGRLGALPAERIDEIVKTQPESTGQ